MFGGVDSQDLAAPITWFLTISQDGKSGTWSQLNTDGIPHEPMSRMNAAMVTTRNGIVLFGGVHSSSFGVDYLDDCWLLLEGPTGWKWIDITLDAFAPSYPRGRAFHQIVSAGPTTSRITFHGGGLSTYPFAEYGDTWIAEIKCPDGYTDSGAANQHRCVPCPIGTYSGSVDPQCYECEAGTTTATTAAVGQEYCNQCAAGSCNDFPCSLLTDEYGDFRFHCECPWYYHNSEGCAVPFGLIYVSVIAGLVFLGMIACGYHVKHKEKAKTKHA